MKKMKLYELLLVIVFLGVVSSVLFPSCVGPYKSSMTNANDFDYSSQTSVNPELVKKIHAIAVEGYKKRHHHIKK